MLQLPLEANKAKDCRTLSELSDLCELAVRELSQLNQEMANCKAVPMMFLRIYLVFMLPGLLQSTARLPM